MYRAFMCDDEMWILLSLKKSDRLAGGRFYSVR